MLTISLHFSVDSEIEKLKLSEMTCREGVIEVAKMYVFRLFLPSYGLSACMACVCVIVPTIMLAHVNTTVKTLFSDVIACI